MFASEAHRNFWRTRKERKKSGGMVFLFFAVIFSLTTPFSGESQIYKTNNNDALNLGTSWAGGAAPGAGNVAAWDATVATPANCTNTLSASANWGGILISNPVVAVKLLTNNSPVISLGGSGINLSNATANLWIAPAVTTVADQNWTVTNGRTLMLGEAGRNVAIANNVTITGSILFPNTITINSSGSLTVPNSSSVASTITNNAVTSIVVNGAITQTGGTVTIGRSDSTSGSPKATVSIGSTSSGTYNISGGSLIDGSTTSDGRVDVGTGASAPGTVNASGNATLQLQALYIANGGNGTVNVTNGTLTVANNFRVGVSAGIGTMNVFGGTVQSASTLNLPNGPGTGVLNVNGGAVNVSVISVATSSGGSGPGTLTVAGGALTATNGIALAPSTGSATLNLNGGTTVVSSLTHAGSGAATLNWNGGTLKPVANNASFVAGGITANVATNGSVIDTTNFNVTILCSLLNGTGGAADGGLIKIGSGTLTLAVSNSYSGPTVISAGTLTVSTASAIANSTNLSVASGGTLNISGGGTIAVHTTPTLAGTLVMQISRNGATPISDRMAFTGGTINYGGVLTVTTTGSLPIAGDAFNLFSAASFTGGFTTINLPSLSTNLSWDTSRLSVDGSITVITNNVAPSTPPSFGSIALRSGTNVIINGSGGTSNGVYYVLSSTNLNLPLANWTMIGGANLFDTNGNFNFTNTMNPARPAQFFALSLSPQALSASDASILQALQNMRDEGFNSYLPSPGGLYINWIYTNSPPVSSNNVNLNTDGTPDASPTVRHDRLTDVGYLACLSLYKQIHPLDTQFDSGINRYTTICLSTNDDNFLGSPDERGWIYWVLEDIIPSVPAFVGSDNAQADKYYNQYIKNLGKYPGVTPLFLDFSTNEPGGYYTVANEVEDGCVLIVNGRKRGLASYIAAGENLLAFQRSNSWSTNLLLWAKQMGHVFTDGTKTQIAPPSAEYIYDGVIKPGELGEMTEALCWAEQADPGHGYGAWAKSVLDNLQPSVNGYTLWDSTYGGYYTQLQFTGSTNIYSPSLHYTLDTAYRSEEHT